MSYRRAGRLALAAIGLAFALSACVPNQPGLNPAPPDQAPPANSPTLTRTDVVTGLTRPWDLAFVDADTFFFTQRGGAISVRDGTNAPAVLTGGPTDVVETGEGGMMGIAVDPSFATNRRIYVCFTTSGDNRVVRFDVSSALTALSNRVDLVTGMTKASIHDGCRVRFSPPSRNLWVTMGDAAVGSLPQNINSLNGKVLRISPDTANTGVSGNPFVGRAGDDRIYTYGHRNPQGIAFRPSNGQPYSVEHGPDKNDEVNRLVAGGNSGWDPVGCSPYCQSVPMTDLQKFPGAMIPAWRSGDSGTLAPSGATFLTGSQWKSWNGALVVGFLKDARARAMFLDGNGNVSFATTFLANNTRLRSVVQGPDGNLYVATDVGTGQGAIWKVTPS